MILFLSESEKEGKGEEDQNVEKRIPKEYLRIGVRRAGRRVKRSVMT